MFLICCQAYPLLVLQSPAATEACQGCRADFNCYGGVGSADLGLLLGAWGTDDSIYDLDGDGEVGGSDIGALVAQWGPCR